MGIISHGNNAFGGFAVGMQKSKGKFALSNSKGLYLKEYKNGWGGNGSVKTYSFSKWGARLGTGNLMVSLVIGYVQIDGAYQYDKSKYKSEKTFGNVGAKTEQQVGSTALGFASGAVAGYAVLGIFSVITAPAWVAIGTAVVIGGVAGWALSELGDEAVEQIQEYKGSTIINGYDVDDSNFKD